MKREFIFLGAPGCGKGTQTSHLSQYLNFPHIDTGSLLRTEIENKTSDGICAKRFIDEGQLVPIKLVSKIIKNRLVQPDAQNGFILDGYPRSLEQAYALEKIQEEVDGSLPYFNKNIDFKAIYFEIPEHLLIERLVNRRMCTNCGAIYNIKTRPPKTNDVCDKCAASLMQRKDDNEETAHKRFETYYNETAPLIEFYKNKHVLYKIDADASVDEIFEKLKSVIK